MTTQPVPPDRAGPVTPAGLRVAFVLGLATGGTASHVVALAAGCRAAGLAVSVLGPPPALELFGADEDTVAVAIADRPHPVRDAAAIIRLRATLTGWQPDVVHAHGVRAGAFAALAVATLPGTRPALVITVHNAPPDGQAARFVHGVLERICARRADLVLAASADLLARMRGRRAPVEQFDVPALPAAAPTAAEVAKARADVGADDRPVVLAVARLAPQKGLDVLIDAAARWRARDPRPRTVIAGDGPLAAGLRAQASRSGADVGLLGARHDVPALLAVADVVVVPSRWEARALVLQEAMRAGRPIVATSVGGTPGLAGPDGAILVPAGDADALAKAVAAVLDDPPRAARLGEAARARSATFPSHEDAVAALLACYARLAHARRRN